MDSLAGLDDGVRRKHKDRVESIVFFLDNRYCVLLDPQKLTIKGTINLQDVFEAALKYQKAVDNLKKMKKMTQMDKVREVMKKKQTANEVVQEDEDPFLRTFIFSANQEYALFYIELGNDADIIARGRLDRKEILKITDIEVLESNLIENFFEANKFFSSTGDLFIHENDKLRWFKKGETTIETFDLSIELVDGKTPKISHATIMPDDSILVVVNEKEIYRVNNKDENMKITWDLDSSDESKNLEKLIRVTEVAPMSYNEDEYRIAIKLQYGEEDFGISVWDLRKNLEIICHKVSEDSKIVLTPPGLLYVDENYAREGLTGL